MGNPAGQRHKLRKKRRKKYDARLVNKFYDFMSTIPQKKWDEIMNQIDKSKSFDMNWWSHTIVNIGIENEETIS